MTTASRLVIDQLDRWLADEFCLLDAAWTGAEGPALGLADQHRRDSFIVAQLGRRLALALGLTPAEGAETAPAQRMELAMTRAEHTLATLFYDTARALERRCDELADGIRADMLAGAASLDELIDAQLDLERTLTLSQALLAEAGSLLGPPVA
ncbi:MAG TPA: hypothetical protein VGE07_26860 [Herpetosiphonaceae bacterium]